MVKQPEEEQGTVGQRERRGRQPVIARDIEGEGRQEAGLRPVVPARHPRQDPRRAGEKHDEADPQGPSGRSRADSARPAISTQAIIGGWS